MHNHSNYAGSLHFSLWVRLSCICHMVHCSCRKSEREIDTKCKSGKARTQNKFERLFYSFFFSVSAEFFTVAALFAQVLWLTFRTNSVSMSSSHLALPLSLPLFHPAAHSVPFSLSRARFQIISYLLTAIELLQLQLQLERESGWGSWTGSGSVSGRGRLSRRHLKLLSQSARWKNGERWENLNMIFYC